MHVEQGHQPAAVRAVPLALLEDVDALDVAAFGGEPALAGEIGRQHLALQLALRACRHGALDRAGAGPAAREGQPALGHHQHRQFAPRQALLVPVRHLDVGGQAEAVVAVTLQRQQVGQFADGRECSAAEQFHRHARLELREIQFDRLRRAREVDDAEDLLVFPFAHEGEDLAVARLEELQGAAAEGAVVLAHGDEALGPVEQGGRVAALRLDVVGLVAVDRIHDRRQEQPLRIGLGEAGIAVGAPLHWRAHAVAVAQVNVVAHADFVAVVQDGRSGQRHQQEVHQFDLVAVVVHQRRQAAADADIDAHARIDGVHAVHVVALAAGDHLQRQFVVVAQEDRPLAGIRDVRRLPHDLDDGMPVLLRHRHEDARHDGEVVGHVAFVAVAEVLAHVLRPLVGLGQQHAVLVVRVDDGAHLLDDVVGLRQVLVGGALAHAKIGNGVEAQPVHADVQPEAHDADHRLHHFGVVVVEVGLVGEEAVPVVGLRHLVPGPVRLLRVGEDDARLGEPVVAVAPDVEVAFLRAGRRAPRRLEPGVLVGGVVDDQFGNHLEAAPVRLAHEVLGVGARAVLRVHVAVVGDVVAVVAEGRRVEGQQPEGVDAQVLQVVEFLREALEIADAVVAAVEEGLDVQFVDDGVLVPERVVHPVRHARAAVGTCFFVGLSHPCLSAYRK